MVSVYKKSTSSYILSKNNLFDSIKKRVEAEHTGSTVIIPHVCNNIDLFGAGFASAVAQAYPSVKQDYHLLGKSFLRNNLGHSQFIKVYEEKKYKHKIYFVNMIAQNGVKNPNNSRPLNYAALASCMLKISHFINQNTGFLNKSEQVEIHAPKFGSGLSGGNWNFISDLIEDVWSKYMVYIYEYNKK